METGEIMEALFNKMAAANDNISEAYLLLKEAKQNLVSADRLQTLDQVSKSVFELANSISADMNTLLENFPG